MIVLTPVGTRGPTRVPIGVGGSGMFRLKAILLVLAGIVVGGAFGGIVYVVIRTSWTVPVFVGIGGVAGWALATPEAVSPMKTGESLGTWIRLTFDARRRRVRIGDRDEQVYVGMCPLEEVEEGDIAIVGSSVRVAPGSVDDQGWPLDDRARPKRRFARGVR